MDQLTEESLKSSNYESRIKINEKKFPKPEQTYSDEKWVKARNGLFAGISSPSDITFDKLRELVDSGLSEVNEEISIADSKRFEQRGDIMLGSLQTNLENAKNLLDDNIGYSNKTALRNSLMVVIEHAIAEELEGVRSQGIDLPLSSTKNLNIDLSRGSVGVTTFSSSELKADTLRSKKDAIKKAEERADILRTFIYQNFFPKPSGN